MDNQVKTCPFCGSPFRIYSTDEENHDFFRVEHIEENCILSQVFDSWGWDNFDDLVNQLNMRVGNKNEPIFLNECNCCIDGKVYDNKGEKFCPECGGSGRKAIDLKCQNQK